MLNETETWQILRQTGALLEGHYRLTSGLHSDRFLVCSQTMQYPVQTEALCRALAELFAGEQIGAVVGAATGGIILAYELARALGARAIFAEKVPEGGMKLRRGFTLSPGERVLLAEDAVSTGGSVRKVMEAIAPLQPEIVGVAALIDRSAGQVDFGVPLRCLITTHIPHWTAAECPMCKAGQPLWEPKG